MWTNLNEALRILLFFLRKEKTNSDYSTIRLICVTGAPFLENIHWTQTAYDDRICFLCLFTLWFAWKQRIRVVRLTQKSIRCLRSVNKVSFILFAYKKYSHRFIKSRLNHWWQMDYFEDVFHTFLDLDSFNCLAVNGTVTSLPVFIPNILNCEDERSCYGFGTTWE